MYKIYDKIIKLLVKLWKTEKGKMTAGGKKWKR